MRTLKVSLGGAPKKGGAKASKVSKKAPKPMSFSEWVDHYAKMSGGNPV